MNCEHDGSVLASMQIVDEMSIIIMEDAVLLASKVFPLQNTLVSEFLIIGVNAVIIRREVLALKNNICVDQIDIAIECIDRITEAELTILQNLVDEQIRRGLSVICNNLVKMSSEIHTIRKLLDTEPRIGSNTVPIPIIEDNRLPVVINETDENISPAIDEFCGAIRRERVVHRMTTLPYHCKELPDICPFTTRYLRSVKKHSVLHTYNLGCPRMDCSSVGCLFHTNSKCWMTKHQKDMIKQGIDGHGIIGKETSKYKFPCDVPECKFNGRTANYLVVHQRRHKMMKDGMKIECCNRCGYLLTSNATLRRHLNSCII